MGPILDQSGISRRQFLDVILAASTLGLGTGALVWSRLPDRLPDASHLSAVDDGGLLVLQHLARLWLPRGAGSFISYTELPVIEQFDAWLNQLPESTREDFLFGIRGFDYAGFVIGGGMRPFTTMTLTDGEAYVQSWFEGSAEQRGLVGALRQILHLSYWRHAETWPATGYRGPLHLRREIPALGEAPMPKNS